MNKPTICFECKHCFTSLINSWFCKLTEKEEVSYLTGKTQKRYEYCTKKNTDGNCKDF